MVSKTVALVGDSPATPPINPEQSLKAAKALIKHMKKAAVDKASKATTKLNPLDDEEAAGSSALSDTPVLLTLTTKTFISDTNRLKPGKIQLPHPLTTTKSDTTICLLVADPQRAYKDMVASESFPSDLRDRISRVIGFDKLKRKFKTFEAQRQLYASHDVFLADDRIVNRLPNVLGKTFYKNTTKRPIPIVMSPNNKSSKKSTPKGTGLRTQSKTDDIMAVRSLKPEAIAKEIIKAIGAAPVHLSPSTNTCVRVGFADWDPSHIAENVDVAVKALVSKWVPKQWSNVRSFYLKGPTTTALPIWMADELWVGQDSVVAAPVSTEAEGEGKGKKKGKGKGKEGKLIAEGEKETANTKKKRKSLDNAAAVEEPKRKKAKGDKGDKELLKKLATARKTKLSKEKAAARKSMD